jgi:hypothetical protein
MMALDFQVKMHLLKAGYINHVYVFGLIGMDGKKETHKYANKRKQTLYGYEKGQMYVMRVKKSLNSFSFSDR